MNWITKFFAAPQGVGSPSPQNGEAPGANPLPPAGAAPFRTAWMLRIDSGKYGGYCDTLYSQEYVEKKKKIAAFLDEKSEVTLTYVKVHIYLAGCEQGDAI